MLTDKIVVYVIKNQKTGINYIGQTKNLKRRLFEHNHGFRYFTSHKGHWDLIYTEEFTDRFSALRREKKLKSGKGREFLKEKLYHCVGA